MNKLDDNRQRQVRSLFSIYDRNHRPRGETRPQLITCGVYRRNIIINTWAGLNLNLALAQLTFFVFYGLFWSATEASAEAEDRARGGHFLPTAGGPPRESREECRAQACHYSSGPSPKTHGVLLALLAASCRMLPLLPTWSSNGIPGLSPTGGIRDLWRTDGPVMSWKIATRSRFVSIHFFHFHLHRVAITPELLPCTDHTFNWFQLTLIPWVAPSDN